ncbi:putative defensin-like protein 62 [Arabidopsis thaliana]|uniref:Putative defensin-like protein 62 n=3 Tax=Arabidopsis TaxID=3701 RepID=DEF62_ARATH|nr:defensin-like protein [Arabidopsis thaliana]Q2V485.1 RecName: Full=Putative defensin-like protein 62; Flags: Precursor [Arabidopsis thaliana]AEC06239.1 defensin-like protein [Arabidopsis thaliana]KAG7636141.1 hypothetical protein ISN45_At02g007610 [Arabidopsis thaliana x Arabidopsis arenosa]VYS52303.1 unnamed protein product [Arabidopsis thaliana]|eukprot:NP_001031353.1 defensin-like protein [Arabidopsis thaliana]
MDVTKTYVTIFVVAILTISVLIQIQQYDRCIGPCLRFYGNHQCYKNCRKAKYDGGQCDFVKKGEKLPECCCYYNKN